MPSSSPTSWHGISRPSSYDRLGLDRHPELRDLYFGNYRKLIYLSQEEDPELQKQAREAAEQLDLEYEYRFTGYGDLETVLRNA